MERRPVSYRPDIDGLRALAILPVIWFHSGLPGLRGGFTGVDTFFVISGYLITLIIHREVAAGTFSAARFYERRVRRIAPALLLMIGVSTVAAYMLLLPYELTSYSETALAAMAMVSNVYLWRANSYFAIDANITPLLHTWSLGVEEQFYLLFPAVLLLAERRRLTRPAIAVLALTSFALCVIVTAWRSAAAFFLLPTRGWELMAGAALAVGLVSIPPRQAAAASLSGIALIVAAAILIPADVEFPGWRALVPALGAALVIGAGPQTPGGKLLSASLLVAIGRISYSLYLWHWPVFVFMRHWRADPRLPPVWAIAGIALTFALSIASYYWIERPARRSSTPYRTVVLSCGLAAAVLLLPLSAAIIGHGLPNRLSPEVDSIAARRDAYAPLARSCPDIPFEQALEQCHIGPPGRPTFVLWGDSHAAAVSEGVATGLRQPGLVASQSLCTPGFGWVSPNIEKGGRPGCRKFNADVLRYVEQHPSVSLVILSVYWNAHDRTGGRAFWQSEQRMVDRLAADGKRVVILAGIPAPGVDVPWAAALRARFGRPPLRLRCTPAAVPLTNVTIIDVSADFCRWPVDQLFVDDDHISRFAGLAIIAPKVSLAHVVTAGNPQADVAER